ncbi:MULTISPECIES: hypothetical protein [Streptomyces violaceusniger group]|uniref:hypothetical protein n=1 Tax=Streptomyces violaceusniger group TaxID=2839105 RepID=UPI00118130F2|nr:MULTISPECIES: hypothetical protein [Streptomyces violaceusniger group]
MTSAGLTLAGLAFSLFPGTAQADDATTAEQILNYTAYLKTASLEDDQARETLDQFQNLSGTEKARFVTLINDPDFVSKFLYATTSEPAASGERVELAGGDVVIEYENSGGASDGLPPNDDSAAQASRVRDMWASYAVNDKILGIKVSQVKVRTNYQVKGKDTRKVYPGSATHFLYVPGCSFSHSPVKEWISSPPADNAQSETVWTADCWGSSWDKRERVWGDYRGFVGGYLKE